MGNVFADPKRRVGVASLRRIVVKEAGAAQYSRFDYTAWGEPIWIDRFIPDAAGSDDCRNSCSPPMEPPLHA
jgi:hypothetical protein